MPYDIELMARLAQNDELAKARSIVGIGNAFGYSTLALAALFPKARVDVMDAEVEGSSNRRGSDVTRRVAQANGLNVHVHVGFSPWDLHRIFEANGNLAVGLAFIDGLHTDAQQYMDWSALRPHLAHRHVVILHDVQLTKINKSLELIQRQYSGRIWEYEGVNFCNRFGTHIATHPRDLLDF